MVSEPKEGLVPVEKPSLSLLGGVTGGCRLLYCSMELQKPEVKDLVARAVTDELVNIWDQTVSGPFVVIVQHAICLMVQQPDEETGELTEKIKLVLVNPEGKGYVTSSGVAATYMERLLAIYNKLPWNPPRAVEFRRTVTRSKNVCLTCTIPSAPTKAAVENLKEKDKPKGQSGSSPTKTPNSSPET